MTSKGVRHSMYYLTRDMRFVACNISGYIDANGTVRKLYEVQLNQTYQNANCRDLTYWRTAYTFEDYFLIFCKSYRPHNNGKSLQSFITVFALNKTDLFNYIDNPDI
jgi:hypothetical protein